MNTRTTLSLEEQAKQQAISDMHILYVEEGEIEFDLLYPPHTKEIIEFTSTTEVLL